LQINAFLKRKDQRGPVAISAKSIFHAHMFRSIRYHAKCRERLIKVPRAQINHNRNATVASLETGSTNCLVACLVSPLHMDASLHRIRLPPSGAITKRRTRRIAFTSRCSVSQECTAEYPFLDFSTQSYFSFSS